MAPPRRAREFAPGGDKLGSITPHPGRQLHLSRKNPRPAQPVVLSTRVVRCVASCLREHSGQMPWEVSVFRCEPK